jgi:CubicO group peptidase (beta-lactamase class C family)
MLNSALLKRGTTTKNITKDMNLKKSPTATDIISYMLSTRLDYTPGTKSVISNLGYVILGRIIER